MADVTSFSWRADASIERCEYLNFKINQNHHKSANLRCYDDDGFDYYSYQFMCTSEMVLREANTSRFKKQNIPTSTIIFIFTRSFNLASFQYHHHLRSNRFSNMFPNDAAKWFLIKNSTESRLLYHEIF